MFQESNQQNKDFHDEEDSGEKNTRKAFKNDDADTRRDRSYTLSFLLVVLSLFVGFFAGWFFKPVSSSQSSLKKLETVPSNVVKFDAPSNYIDSKGKTLRLQILAKEMFKNPPCDVTKTPISYNSDAEVVILNLKEGEVAKDREVEELPKLGPGQQIRKGIVVTEQTNEGIFKISKPLVAKKIIAVVGGFGLSEQKQKKVVGQLKSELDSDTKKQLEYIKF